MATLAQILAASRSDAEEADSGGLLSDFGDAASDVFGGALEFGAGSLNELLDLLNRPQRALYHGLRGDFEQAASALIPFGKTTGLTGALGLPESKPIFASDLLAEMGVEEGGQMPLGLGSARAGLGFGIDVLADPTILIGAPIAKLAARGLGKAALGIKLGAGALARSGIPMLSDIAGGAERLGGKMGSAFIKDFDIASANLHDPERLKDLFHGAEADARLSTRRYIERTERMLKTVEEEDAIRLTDLIEEPGAQNYFLTKRAGADPEQLRDIMKLVPDDVKIAERAAKARVALDNLTQKENDFLSPYMVGEPADTLGLAPGKRGAKGLPEHLAAGEAQVLGTEAEFVERGILSEEGMRAMFLREGVDHVPHFASTGKAMRWAADRLADETGLPVAETAAAAQKLMKYAEAAGEATQARRIAGTLKQIEERIGRPIFERNLARIALGEGRRFVAVKTVDDVFSGITSEPKWFQTSEKTLAQSEIPRGWRRVNLVDMPETVRKQFPKAVDAIMPEAIAERMFGKNGWAARMRGTAGAGPFISTLRSFNRYYKPWTLAWPATVLRNVVGDLWLNYLSGVNPARYYDARGFLLNASKGWKGPIGLGGRTFEKSELLDEMIRHGVVGESLAHTDMGAAALSPMLDPKLAGRTRFRRAIGLDPRGNLWTRYMNLLNRTASDHTRVAHFLDRVAKGDTLEAAALSVKKNLFSIENLSEWERTTLNEVFPFYSWMRQSVPRNLRGLVETPSKFAHVAGVKVRLDRDGRVDEIPDDVMPEWLQGQMMLPVSRQDGVLKIFALNNWLPIADLTEVNSPKQFVRWAAKSLSPLVQEPFEQTFGWDLFFRDQIEKFDGEKESLLGLPLGRRLTHLLRNVRVLNELDRSVAPALGFKAAGKSAADAILELTRSEAALRAVTGLKPRGVDLQRSRQFAIRKLEREEGTMKARIKYARRDGNMIRARSAEDALRALRDTLRLLRGFRPETHPVAYGAAG